MKQKSHNEFMLWESEVRNGLLDCSTHKMSLLSSKTKFFKIN